METEEKVPLTPGPRRALSVLAALALTATMAATAVGKQPENRPNPPGQKIPVQLLAFNDYHGHLQANSPGMIDGVAAGGAEYLAAELARLRQGKKFSLTVAAGDLIGGSPAFSGLFHDEPSVESLNAMHLDVSSVGNHEFDEGVTELLRMQNGGCHPVDGCYFPEAPYAGRRLPVAGGQRRQRDHRQDGPAALLDQEVQQRQGRLHRHDPRGHRHPGRRCRDPGLGLQGRGRDREQARPEAQEEGRRGDRRAAARGWLPDAASG